MPLLVDTHVHLYDCYNLNLAFESALKNLSNIQEQYQLGPAHFALCLTEKSGCHFFKRLVENPAALLDSSWKVENINSVSFKIQTENHSEIYVLAGRQIATEERLELLALGQDLDIADRQSLEVTWRSVIQQQAIPVIPWSLGKWWGKRGQVIQQLLDIARPNEIFLADSSLRSSLWQPKLIKQELLKGHKVLAGTDPFPRSGEEKIIGSYVSYFSGKFEPEDPVTSLKNILMAEDQSQIFGSRVALFRMLSKALNLP